MGFSLRRPGQVPQKPKRARFDGSSGSESDEDSLFARAILKKAAKVLRTLEEGTKTEEIYTKKLEEAPEPKKEAKTPGSKYLGLLREAKRQRDQLQALNTAQARDAQVQKQLEANSELEVFETDAYKEQRDQALVQIVEKEEPMDMGLFYTKILDARTGNGELGPDRTVTQKNAPHEAPLADAAASRTLKGHHKSTPKPSRNPSEWPKHTREPANTVDEDSRTRFLNAVKQYVLSKVTEGQLREYRKLYWQRRKNENHDW